MAPGSFECPLQTRGSNQNKQQDKNASRALVAPS